MTHWLCANVATHCMDLLQIFQRRVLLQMLQCGISAKASINYMSFHTLHKLTATLTSMDCHCSRAERETAVWMVTTWTLKEQPYPFSGDARLVLFFFYNCIVPLEFLPWEIHVVFLKESQLWQSHTAQPEVHAGCFSASTIHWTPA